MSVNKTYKINDDGRECACCEKLKPWSEFHKCATKPYGHKSVCKQCRRETKDKSRGRTTARIDDLGRECNFCHEYKLYSEFSKKSNCPHGHYTICKKCTSIKTKLQRYNLTLSQYNELLQEYNGKCAICGNEETAITKYSGNVKSLAIDHCHKTGKIRGMLCSKCNAALGMVKDSVLRIQDIMSYLENNLDLEPNEREKARNFRDAALQYLYGITIQEYNEILESQNGGCAICGLVPDYGKDLGVDHDHVTGKVRGLLCVNCNTAIGCFDDSRETMKSAITYLSNAYIG